MEILSIKGITGSKGWAKGKVRKVLEGPELENIEEGEVLVARYATAAISVVKDKIVAVVTDQGGLTSHSALLSRENRIPAVVGTDRATELLCDGDLVEVDANNGVVKLLKRASK